MEMTFDEFVLHAIKAHHACRGELRYGQVVFNELHTIRPDVAETLRGTANDPFYKRVVSDETWRVIHNNWGDAE